MSARIVGTLLAASFLFPGAGKAQDAPNPEAPQPPSATVPVTQAEFQGLKQQVEKLAAAIGTPSENAGNADQLPLVPVPAAGGQEVSPDELAKLKQEVEELKSKVDKLQPKVDTLTEIAADQDAKLGAVAKKISENGTDTWIPDIRRAWASKEFREDMSREVRDSLQQQGSLQIRNKTSIDQTLLINGSQHVDIPAGETRVVRDLPCGTVSTELLGYEAPRNWTIGPPNYEQTIDITPSSPTRVVVARPTTPSEPAIIEPAIFEQPIVIGPAVVVDPPVLYLW
jgi:hypothetical protein